MKVCNNCGRKFNFDEEESNFSYGWLSYYNFKLSVCAECAENLIDDEVSGVYFEECQSCGKEFDYIEDSQEFSISNDDLSLSDVWEIETINKCLCCNCAVNALEEYNLAYEDDEDSNSF